MFRFSKLASTLAVSAVFSAAGLSPVLSADRPTKAPAVASAPVGVSHKTVKIDDLEIFYREAGPADAPTVLLLHGFPTS